MPVEAGVSPELAKYRQCLGRRNVRKGGRVRPTEELVHRRSHRSPFHSCPIVILALIWTAQPHNRFFDRSFVGHDQRHRVTRFHVKDPFASVYQSGDRSERSVLKNRLSPRAAALGHQRGAGQHDAICSACTGQVPEPPAECLVEIGVTGAHSRKRTGSEQAAIFLGVFNLFVVFVNQIRALPSVASHLRLLLSRRFRLEAGKSQGPEPEFLHGYFIPWRVADQAVEAGPVAQEHFGEGCREVQRIQLGHSLDHVLSGGSGGYSGVVGDVWQIHQTSPMGGDHIEQVDDAGVAKRREGVGVSLSGIGNLGRVGVGGESESRQNGPDLFHLGLQEHARSSRLATGSRLERLHRLFQGADPHQAVAAHQVVVQEAQRQAGDEGVYPHSQAGQLYGNWIYIDTVDTAPGHLAAQQSGVVDLEVGGGVGQRVPGCLAQSGQFGGHAGHGIDGEPI